MLAPAGYANLTSEVAAAVLSQSPTALSQVPIPQNLMPAILGAFAEAEAHSWKYVWIAISMFVLANAIASCFLQSVSPRMNDHIESALEISEVREKQMGSVQ